MWRELLLLLLGLLVFQFAPKDYSSSSDLLVDPVSVVLLPKAMVHCESTKFLEEMPIS